MVDQSRPRGPSVFIILFAVLALAVAATWMLPAGRFATARYDAQAKALVVEDGGDARTLPATQASLDRLGVRVPLEELTGGTVTKPVAIPGSYRPAEPAPQSPLALLTAPVKGLTDAVEVVGFILVIGGFITVFDRSGALAIGIGALVRRFAGREHWLVVVLIPLFALGGATFGMHEETVAFYPLLVPVFAAAGFHRIVPLAVILGGSCFGTVGGVSNPFAVVIASALAGADWTAGAWYLAAAWVAGVVILTAWTLRFAARTRRADATMPDARDVPAMVETAVAAHPLRAGDAVQLLLFAGTFAAMIAGVAALGWWFGEMSALFLGAAVLSGLLQRGTGRIDAFVRGASDLLGVALVVVLARAVPLVLAAGSVEATLVQGIGTALAGTPPAAFLIGAFLFFALFSLTVSSSSSAAALFMPLLGPVAAAIGVAGWALVVAFVFGENILQLLSPTSIALPSLALAGVAYKEWARFALPPVLALGAVCTVLLAVAA